MRPRCLFTLFMQPLKQAMSQSHPFKEPHYKYEPESIGTQRDAPLLFDQLTTSPKHFTFGCGSKPQMRTLLKLLDDMSVGPSYTLMFANCRPKTKVKPLHDCEIERDRKPVFRAHWALKCLLSHVRELLCKLVRISEEVTCFHSQVCMINRLLSVIYIG